MLLPFSRAKSKNNQTKTKESAAVMNKPVFQFSFPLFVPIPMLAILTTLHLSKLTYQIRIQLH